MTFDENEPTLAQSESDFVTLAQTAAMPVYGLPDTLFGAQLSHFGWAGAIIHPETFSLDFLLTGVQPEVSSSIPPSFFVESKIRAYRGSKWTPQRLLSPFLSDAHTAYIPHHLSEQEVAQFEPAQIIEQQLTIAGRPFSGGMVFWLSPFPLAIFALVHVGKPSEGRIVGKIFGLSLSEARTALEHLVVVNQRLDLLHQYEDEMKRLAETSGRSLAQEK